MGNFKRVMAVLLVLAMAMSLALTASAAGSPTEAPQNPNYDVETKKDTNEQDHSGNIVVTKVTSKIKTVLKVTGDTSDSAKKVTIQWARNKNDKQVGIKQIGDGEKGVFNSKAGRRVTKVTLKTGSQVTIKNKAFKGSEVKSLVLAGNRYYFEKGAFKSTKVENITIKLTFYRDSTKKVKASKLTFEKGAFNGLSSKAKFIVDKAAMGNGEFIILTRKLRAAGFEGKIVRK